jgi:hypothetical protein
MSFLIYRNYLLITMHLVLFSEMITSNAYMEPKW